MISKNKKAKKDDDERTDDVALATGIESDMTIARRIREYVLQIYFQKRPTTD